MKFMLSNEAPNTLYFMKGKPSDEIFRLHFIYLNKNNLKHNICFIFDLTHDVIYPNEKSFLLFTN